ncbi:MAG: hemerythrin family protein [Eubacterium sp.]|nr:hemerythrin family protein [Eubacterium sp.]
MTVLEWNDRLNIGVELIDNAHKKLFSIMRRMARLQENPENYKLLCQEGIKYFKSYTLNHFAEEEAYMQSIHYERYEMHKRLHENLRDKTLPVLEKEVLETDCSVESVQRFMGVCMAWLTQHIMIEDRAITGKVPAPHINGRPKDEADALSQSVIQVLKTILGMDAETASEHYQGEDTGTMAFCRLAYRSSQGKPVNAYLGYQDSLIFSIVSEMTGARMNKLDKMSLCAIQQISRSVMHQLKAYFPDTDACTLEKENLISYEIMRKTLLNYSPYISFLFRTQAGYFVFCIQK